MKKFLRYLTIKEDDEHVYMDAFNRTLIIIGYILLMGIIIFSILIWK